MMTVVVPVYGQWPMVNALLECLRQQTLPAPCFRVVLVNNESGVDITAYQRESVTVLDCHAPGAYAARNLAIERYRACTTWFVFTDADCRPAPDWLAQFEHAMQRYGSRWLISGAVVVVPSSDSPNWSEIYDTVKGIPQHDYAKAGFGATANLAVAANVFRRVGHFDDSWFSGGDKAFCLKAAAQEFTLHYCPEACVQHPARMHYRDISRKARRLTGSQVARSRGLERAIRVLYSLLPPVIPVTRLMRRRHQRVAHRFIASLVQCRLWLDQIPEVFKALRGCPLERG